MSCLPTRLWVFLATVVFTVSLLAQQQPTSAIHGLVTDAETGAPLENAIVFLANTAFGVSTGTNGNFVLDKIPEGDYELIVSRVGYERHSLTIHVAPNDSLFLEIRLQPRPVHTGGVEVLAESVGESRPVLLFPEPMSDSYTLFGVLSSLPIGILFVDSGLYMYALEPAILDSAKYVRLWLMYRNMSETTRDFDPCNSVQLDMRAKDHSYEGIVAESPQRILSIDDVQSLKGAISQRIGKTLEQLAVVQTKHLYEQAQAEKRALRDEWIEMNTPISKRKYIPRPLRFAPATAGSLSADLYNTYRSGTSVGVLQRYEVYPGNGVHGYICFAFPGLNWKATTSWFIEAAQYEYEIELSTPNGVKHIAFAPH